MPDIPITHTVAQSLKTDPAVETVEEKYPPLQGWSTTATPGVTGVNTKSGPATSGTNTGGGVGVYGKSSGNAGVFDGNVQVNGNLTCSGDIFLTGADCAEQFDVAGIDPIGEGSLVCTDEFGALIESCCEYDHKVVGVVAGAGKYRPGIVLDRQAGPTPRVVISLMGKAYCKVDAEHTAVQAGDLLTSSSTPGHAMKATDPEKAFGAVIGKALQPLASGKGLIPILVALQ
jgi:hypothetical protein